MRSKKIWRLKGISIFDLGMVTIISNSAKETEDIAKRLAKTLKAGDVLALIGSLGSGKTVFVKGLAKGLGCMKSVVLSPTFVLMRQYEGRLILNHFDLYRLTSIRQLQEIGYEEYFYGDGVAVIEWANRIKEALPKEYLKIEFRIINRNKRLVKFMPKGKQYAYNIRCLKGKTA